MSAVELPVLQKAPAELLGQMRDYLVKLGASAPMSMSQRATDATRSHTAQEPYSVTRHRARCNTHDCRSARPMLGVVHFAAGSLPQRRG